VLLLVSAIIALGGIALAYYMYVLKPALPKELAKRFGWLYTLLQHKYYVDEAYMAVIVNPLRDLGGFCASVIDRGLVDGIVNGVGSITVGSGGLLARLQGGLVRGYALSILLGVAAILGYLALR
jgi:NADH-quinone oxidoreductase subunit L